MEWFNGSQRPPMQVYEDKCSVTYETELEEQCTTQQEEKCETKYDTVTETKCETQYETVYDEQCAPGDTETIRSCAVAILRQNY